MSGAKCLVSLMVVLVAGVCVVSGQDRIKICGRELIRLAVSSCGNSRLRRSIPELELEQHHHGNSHKDQGVSTEEDQAASEFVSAPSQSGGEQDNISMAPHWYPVTQRMIRAAGKLSDICCEKGCSMRELIQFC